MENLLLTPFETEELCLKNRVVMAPMTRSRAENTIPTDIMTDYYAQRVGAGLIITEGTAPSPNGLGYARIPGIYSDSQAAAWKKVTEAVHEQDSKIFVQLMHSGRIAHPLNMPEGSTIVAPSANAAAGTIWTDQQGMQPYPTPKAMSSEDVKEVIKEFVNASRKAMEAGFDGVELHAANGYLLEQFLNPFVNKRTDEYGGSRENRTRLVLEIATAVSEAIGKEKVGIRLSPFGVNGDMPVYEDLEETYRHLAKELDRLGILYLHLVDHSSMGAPEVPSDFKAELRSLFSNLFILSGGYSQETAVAALETEKGDLVAFGRPFISNPDLVARFAMAAELNEPDFETFYAGGEKGYLDYPVLAEL